MLLIAKYLEILNLNHSIGFSILSKYEGLEILNPSQNNFPIIFNEGLSECLSLKNSSKI
jgi:hypothetical protein